MRKCETDTCNSAVNPPKRFCASCQKHKRSQEFKRWSANNKERLAATNKKWREDNKEHRSQYDKEYRLANKDRLHHNHYEWYRANIDRERAKDAEKRKSPERRFYAVKKRAERNGMVFSISFERFKRLIGLPCYYCNNRLCNPVIAGCGLDRLDSNRGYELDNVVSCGHICNSIKMDYLTPQETKAAVEAILKVRYPE